ncbi:TRAP transporter large permease subunit [Thermoanaerobacter sp.]|uniref:TRAP transporter large permease subunit n=1 Tax=Thermoanaerobacter sp. TaxID=1755 RepID=UPI00338EB70E
MAVVYAFIISLFVYKELKIKDFPKVLINASKTTGQVLLVAATAMSVAWVISTAQLPQAIVNVFSGLISSKLMLLIVINIFLSCS